MGLNCVASWTIIIFSKHPANTISMKDMSAIELDSTTIQRAYVAGCGRF